MQNRRWLAGILLIIWGCWSYTYFFPPRPRVGPLEPVAQAEGPLLLFAPHSDDEALAASGLLQEAEARGQDPHVVLVTGGEAFGLAAKAHFRRWKVSRDEMVAFGEHRVAESQKALQTLGLPEDRLIFLGYPDKRLNWLWSDCWDEAKPCTGPFTKVQHVPYPSARVPDAPFAGASLHRQLLEILKQFHPAVVVYPHPNDAHSDHWALATFITAALEELRRSDATWHPPVEWLYLVHRGDWPAPKGNRPWDLLLPPESLSKDALTVWHEQPLTAEQVRRKYDAVEAYQSQVTIMRRYMHSFVRANELFGTLPRAELPPTQGWSPVAVDVGAPGAEEASLPPWSGLPWQMVIADPRADTMAREVQRGADLLRVWAANDGETLHLAVRTASPPENPVRLHCYARGLKVGEGWGDLAELVVLPGGSLSVRSWPGGTDQGDIAVFSHGSWTRLDLPLAAFAQPASMMVNVETRLEKVWIDRTAWRLLALDGR